MAPLQSSSKQSTTLTNSLKIQTTAAGLLSTLIDYEEGQQQDTSSSIDNNESLMRTTALATTSETAENDIQDDDKTNGTMSDSSSVNGDVPSAASSGLDLQNLDEKTKKLIPKRASDSSNSEEDDGEGISSLANVDDSVDKVTITTTKQSGNKKIPIRRLSQSKKPSLPNVLEDKESNMNESDTSDNYFANSMDSIKVVPKRRSLAGRRSKSRRGSAQKKNSLENVLEDKEAGGSSVNISAIHLSDSSSMSSSSLGTSSSSMMGSSLAGSVNILDFGVSQTIRPTSSYIDEDETPSDTNNPSQRSIDDSSSRGNSILSGPDGFIGWNNSSTRNSLSSNNKKKRGWRKKRSVPKRGIDSNQDSVISNLTMGSSRLGSCSSNITRSSNLSSKVDEDGFLNWSSGRGGESSDALSNSIDTFSSDKKKEEEAKKDTDDVDVTAPLIKKSASGNGLARRIRRVSTNLTASLTNGGGATGNPLRNSLVQKRNSNGSDDAATGFRHSTGQDGPNRRPTNSLFSSVFTRRSSSGGDDKSNRRGSGDHKTTDDDDYYYTQNLRSRLNKRDSETCVDISELRREIVAKEEGKKWKLKNVIF